MDFPHAWCSVTFLTPRRFGFEAFSDWAKTRLHSSDAVVLEATSNAWLLYDQLESLVGSVTVAHPLAVKLIAAARVKTDSRPIWCRTSYSGDGY